MQKISRSILSVLIAVLFLCFNCESLDASKYANQTRRQDVIQEQTLSLLIKLANKTVGILTNPTSTDGQMQPLFERIIEKQSLYKITIKCFFAPEHGLRGDRQDGDGDMDYIDQITGIQVYSLYGVRKAPTSAQLAGLDYLLYDIQDVGCRFYTFIWTLTYTIQALSTAKIELIIFDRPNPLGRKVEGCPLNFDTGLVGRLLPGQTFTIPQRYGLTIGELITYLRPYLPSIKLSIITMRQIYTIHDNQWVLSSPNMPTLETVRVYPGMGLIEGTSMSQGRGTTKPFQITGHPKLNPLNVSKYFSKNNISTTNYFLRENYFIPTFSKHQGEVCGGVQIHIRNYEQYDSVETAMHILRAYLESAVNLNVTVSSGVDKLYGRIGFSQQIQNFNISVSKILDDCKGDLNVYKNQYTKYWLYNMNGTRLSTISDNYELEQIQHNIHQQNNLQTEII